MSLDILVCINRKNARTRSRHLRVDRSDHGMGVRGSQQGGISLTRQRDIVDKLTVARHQPLILRPRQRSPDIRTVGLGLVIYLLEGTSGVASTGFRRLASRGHKRLLASRRIARLWVPVQH
jgi:hypothetical protein